MYEMLMLQTEQAGMQHYEISNFAYHTYHSQHNHNYWLGLPYLGIGPGAHSYKRYTRRWNKGPTLEKIKFATVELYWKDCPKSKRNRPVI